MASIMGRRCVIPMSTMRLGDIVTSMLKRRGGIMASMI